MSDDRRAVLITGCSWGIGRATAARLAGSGWRVYATARRPEAIDGLAGAGCTTLALDVTDEGSMHEAVAAVERAEGAVDVLVNNAGHSLSGAVEEAPIDEVRRQFETNVFGLVRLTQIVLPGMRGQGWGRVVNISSMGGRLTSPGGGFSDATKHAVEALSDALRVEVRGFGIDVIAIDPGLSRTGSGEAVARTVERAISAERPRARYRVTASARLFMGLRRLLPDRLRDRFLRRSFPTPGA